MTTLQASRLVVALDYPDLDSADALVRKLDPVLCRLKVGKELFTGVGPYCIESWQKRGFEIFLDLKFHDIPNTVAAACRAAAQLGVWMIDVHALGGRAMLEAARTALGDTEDRPWLVAVTVLTSLTESDLDEVGLHETTGDLVTRLAGLAQRAGCDGIVCSAHEARAMRSTYGAAFVLVTPGIRPAGSPPDDQRRTLTPAEAIEAGSDYLVVGRPVSGAPDPAAAVRALLVG